MAYEIYVIMQKRGDGKVGSLFRQRQTRKRI